MKGKPVYELKSKCHDLGNVCHNTKNRCIEKMCMVEKDVCKDLGKYLKCLMTIECLCGYICTCCCEMEEVSDPCLQELNQKCDKIMKCCHNLEKKLSKDVYDYLNCNTVLKHCQLCKKMKKNKKNTKRK